MINDKRLVIVVATRIWMQLFCTKMSCQHVKVNSPILAQYEELAHDVANEHRVVHEQMTRR